MKTTLLVLVFLFTFVNTYGQVSDQSGNIAASNTGTNLNGNIKIGNYTNNSDLLIYGELRINDNGGIRFRNDTYQNYGGIHIGDILGNDLATLITAFGEDLTADSVIGLRDGDIIFRTFNKDALYIDQGQNIGIGTINPSYKLDIYGQNALGINGYAIADTNDLTNKMKIGDIDGAGMVVGLYDDNSSELITLTNGKVGIGTTNPDETLAVNGTIHAKEVRVDLTGWPDYVFNQNYELPNFTSIRKFLT